jgi:hypothetical protein
LRIEDSMRIETQPLSTDGRSEQQLTSWRQNA